MTTAAISHYQDIADMLFGYWEKRQAYDPSVRNALEQLSLCIKDRWGAEESGAKAEARPRLGAVLEEAHASDVVARSLMQALWAASGRQSSRRSVADGMEDGRCSPTRSAGDVVVGNRNIVVKGSGEMPLDLQALLTSLGSEPRERIRILFLGADTDYHMRVRIDLELRSIMDVLRRSEHRDEFDLRCELAVSGYEIQEHFLRHQPDIVHFSCHGSPDALLLDNGQRDDGVANRGQTVPGSALASLMAILEKPPRCGILNACHTEAQARAMSRTLGCVIGMSREIRDSSAREFATAFYRALGFGQTVKTAFLMAKNQLQLIPAPDAQVPRLFGPRVAATTRFVGTV